MRALITGGSGFIGSAVIRHLLADTGHTVLNLDKLTYAADKHSLDGLHDHPRYTFVQADIADPAAVAAVVEEFRPMAVMHLAAESHVDRSIDRPADFITTNIVGTYTLLEACRGYWSGLPEKEKRLFRFHHVSTDEVYGDLGPDTTPCTEMSPYQPSSPYSASKASSDHLVRAWHRTFGLPTLVSNCCNNYGPFQFPEKLIPHIVLNALQGRPLPVYGDGRQVRDWLFVDDHARALVQILTRGRPGETYNIGARCERQNLTVLETVCALLEEAASERKPKGLDRYRDLITFVPDRPGHDLRYAIDPGKVEAEFGWRPQETFESGLTRTVQWYLGNEVWWRRILTGEYKLERLGL